MTRREFVGALPALAAAAPGDRKIAKNGWRLVVAANGAILSLKRKQVELADRRLQANLSVWFPGRKAVNVCSAPRSVTRKDGVIAFQYGCGDFTLDYRVELLAMDRETTALRQTVMLNPSRPLAEAVHVRVPRNVMLPFAGRKVFLPGKDGVGRRREAAPGELYVYAFDGAFEGKTSQYLAIPMVDEYSTENPLHVTCCADPFFTTAFRQPAPGNPGEFHWVYSADYGVRGQETRTLYTILHTGDTAKAMEVFYRAAVPDVGPGPDWMHDVAMVGYDYMGQGGNGWFADIDALERLIQPAERPKVLLALHGWYGYIGQYAYDVKARTLAKRWTAMPSAHTPQVQALADRPRSGPWGWRKETMQALHPMEMSIPDMHRRILYAKSKGFRVGLYYGDGMLACEGVKDIYDPDKVLKWGGWSGPDSAGRSYTQNPLHPAVRDFYTGYLAALLAEFGKELDGFIWDETFYVQPGDRGQGRYAGYTARGMMTLVRELAVATAAYSPNLAFFSSDAIGSFKRPDGGPYSLMAHGTYQDSSSVPSAWPAGLIPNQRNVLWSCSWAPIAAFSYTRYAVETFDTPVAFSNGYGEDLGIARLAPDQLKLLMDLFEKRKQRRMQITWIEEQADRLLYQGRDVRAGIPAKV